MKKFLLTGCRPAVLTVLLVCLVYILLGCINPNTGKIDLGAPPLPENLCAGEDPTDSVILGVTEKLHLPLNEVYYGLIDSSSIALLNKKARAVVTKYMFDLADWYNKQGSISYTYLIAYMTDLDKYGAEAALIEGILSRRILKFQSQLLITKYDDCLLRAGWSGAVRDLWLTSPE